MLSYLSVCILSYYKSTCRAGAPTQWSGGLAALPEAMGLFPALDWLAYNCLSPLPEHRHLLALWVPHARGCSQTNNRNTSLESACELKYKD